MILNLLPPAYKLDIAKKRLWQQWQRATILLAFVVLFVTGGLLVGQAHLERESTSITHQLDALQQLKTTTPNQDITTVTTKLNGTITSLSQMVVAPRSVSDDLATVTGIIPSGVIIQSLNLTSSGSLTLQGFASTRQIFITLDDTLKKSPLLTNVTTTATPSKRDNVPFTYTAQLASSSTPL